MARSSSGSGRRPLTSVTRVRIPYALLKKAVYGQPFLLAKIKYLLTLNNQRFVVLEVFFQNIFEGQ